MPAFLSYPAIDTRVFPDSYVDARNSLLTKLTDVTDQHDTYVCHGNTPDGEQLATDVFWLGPKGAHKVLVLLTGTHGVEGFVGSAVTLDHFNLFAKKLLVLPPNTAILIVHALTPWGYAWRRRCDEEGIDLNRNYIDFNNPLPTNSGYKELRNAIFCNDETNRNALLNKFEREHGRTDFEIAFSGGQYADPYGPFYGGDKPAHGRIVSEKVIQQYSLHERTLAVIDLHSGLGAYGYGEIICDHAVNSPGVCIAKLWYGNSTTFPALGTSSSVPKLGLMDYLWHKIMNNRSCHITLEFGSYPTDHLFDVLLRDHQLWSQSENESLRLTHSQLMLEHFCPKDEAWRELVLFRARQVIDQALRGLSGG